MLIEKTHTERRAGHDYITYRIITNGFVYKAQIRCWFWWMSPLNNYYNGMPGESISAKVFDSSEDAKIAIENWIDDELYEEKKKAEAKFKSKKKWYIIDKRNYP